MKKITIATMMATGMGCMSLGLLMMTYGVMTHGVTPLIAGSILGVFGMTIGERFFAKVCRDVYPKTYKQKRKIMRCIKYVGYVCVVALVMLLTLVQM